MRLMPTWTENDSLLCERVENLASVLNLLADDSVEAGLLFGPFGLISLLKSPWSSDCKVDATAKSSLSPSVCSDRVFGTLNHWKIR